MKNTILYYYNITIDNLYKNNNYYYFKYNNSNYIFKICDLQYELIELMDLLSNIIKNNYKFNLIIHNKFNNILSNVNGVNYILVENDINDCISIKDIINISNTYINNYFYKLERNNWELLWGKKIDFYEKFINENYKEYPLIRESIDYFVGLTEIAISYLVNTKLEERPNNSDIKVISHSNISISLYDPTNIIIDHKARDIAEYIKYSFWHNNNNIIKELDDYFNTNVYSKYGIRVLIARIIYPSFYFNIIDKIISDKVKEEEISFIINKINNYEEYLKSILLYIKKKYNLPIIIK